MGKPIKIDKNKKFTSGEEGIIEQACMILERKGINFIYTSVRDRKDYVLRLEK